MSGETLSFPPDFLWGAATSAHQVEGDNRNTDWWAWETDPDPEYALAEPSGIACDHFERYEEDIALLADLGLDTYRFSVEWARIEPERGEFDEAMLEHYAQVVEACRAHGVVPVVTLQHFTLPVWVAEAGGWLADEMPDLFARYAGRVVERIGERVPYVCTINEPGIMLTRSYLGSFPTPPFVRDLGTFDEAAATLNATHARAREVVRELAPDTKVGMTHGLQDWRPGEGCEAIAAFLREVHEDRFFAEVGGDDFIGVQTYATVPVEMPWPVGRVAGAMLESRWLTETLILPALRWRARALEAKGEDREDGERRTQMGYLWAPQAVERTARRVAELFPGKEILITEHGVSTEDDDERIEYIEEGLRAVHRMLDDGLPISGYIHWSLLDNWEWWDGYRPKFGLVEVDRETMERRVKPSARWYGGVAERGEVEIE